MDNVKNKENTNIQIKNCASDYNERYCTKRYQSSRKKRKRFQSLKFIIFLIVITCIFLILKFGSASDITINTVNVLPAVDSFSKPISTTSAYNISSSPYSLAYYIPTTLKINSNGVENFELFNYIESRFPIVVEIHIQNSNRIYRSGAIMPGYFIEKIQLEKTLSQGTYDAYAYVYSFDNISKNVIGKTSQNLVVTVN